MNGVGIVAALAAESRPLGAASRSPGGARSLADGTLLVVSGVGIAAAREGARRLLGAGARALLSWGVAGGLDPALAAGTVVLPREVVSPEGRSFTTEPGWREALARVLGDAHAVSSGRLLTRYEALGSIAAKAQAFRETAAVAVDMESSAVAEMAAAARVPFIAVRALVDTAHDVVPQAAIAAAATGEGALRIGALLLAVARRPSELPPLIRLAGRYRSALRSLSAVARSGALAAQPLQPAARGVLS
ncbi:MAG: purine phosphorylase [Gammaproteobacteria bacterium]|nr:purine phosphorylase [Gammaproteobacteria bacterium]